MKTRGFGFFEDIPILRGNWPPDEKQLIWEIRTALMMQAVALKRFSDALLLFDFCEAEVAGPQAEIGKLGHTLSSDFQNLDSILAYEKALVDKVLLFDGWKQIAARDAAITVWDFAQAIHQTRSTFTKCATLKTIETARAVERAVALFHEYFPNAKYLRHGVTHSADISNTPERNASTVAYSVGTGLNVTGDGKVLASGLSDRTIFATIEGHTVTCDITDMSLSRLIEVRGMLHAALQSACDAAAKNSSS